MENKWKSRNKFRNYLKNTNNWIKMWINKSIRNNLLNKNRRLNLSRKCNNNKKLIRHRKNNKLSKNQVNK